ncbi:MAG TPA: glycosyltransferase family 39 protein, partial [Anaerolineae bacterium]
MSQRRYFYLLLLIIGLGFALRVYQLDAKPFWFDEGISADLAMAPPGYVLQTIDRPPMYYLLLRDWTGVAGVSPFALRFFSAWWGTLALVFLYRLARQVVDRRLSLYALLLATFAPFYVRYAQEARTYSLTLTLALLSCWALLVWLKRGRTRYLVLNAIATLGCLYTHYSLLLLPVAQGLFVLLTTWRDVKRSQVFFTPSTTSGANFFVPLPHHLPKSPLKQQRPWLWIGAQIIVGLLFLPWLLHAWRGLPELIAPQAEPSPFTVWQQGANFTSTTLLEFSAGQPL